ncbi:MAG: FAD:protein FMN transferase [Pseudomonadota bacterium]
MARALLGLSLLLLVACDPGPQTLEFGGETMGTTYTVIALDSTGELEVETVQAAVEEALARVNAIMSNWDPNSEISQFNSSESTAPVAISAELAEVMDAANTVHDQSLGRFDVTLGPLIELWGFGARTAESPVPADEAIAAALDVVGQRDVLTLTDAPATLEKLHAGTTVYLAAIAKGYGVDVVGATLEEFGVDNYMVEIGGDLLTAGTNPDGAQWRIGIERPDAANRTVEEVVEMSDLGMATSGDYRNYFEEDGVRYSHIIDAETGRPITHTTASVTVLAESAMMADAWATALLALGQERGLPIADQNNLAAFFIVRDPSSGETRFATTASARFEELQARN